MIALPASAAAWLLPFVVPIAFWVAWSDLKAMRIPNNAVIALAAVFVIVGFWTLPFPVWAWAWAQLAIVLVIGFLLTLTRMVGAGDAKFAAAMALFILPEDLGFFFPMFAAVAVASLIVHRVLRRIPAVRAAAPTWASWERKEFPMGLALGPSLVFYLAVAAYSGG
jgi:prepilin peptidase CpaA